MVIILVHTIGKFTIKVEQGQFTPKDWPSQANSVYPYTVSITPGRISFKGLDGQDVHNKQDIFYLHDYNRVMDQYREFVRYAWNKVLPADFNIIVDGEIKTTLYDFIADNTAEGVEPLSDQIMVSVMTLKPGQSVKINLGAGGITTIMRPKGFVLADEQLNPQYV